MTTFEHAMLGTTGALAAGLQHRSWQIVAIAGVAAVLPDWDGLSLVFGAAVFDLVHRTVGHSLPIATVVALVVALAEYRVRLLGRFGRMLSRRIEGVGLNSSELEGKRLPQAGVLLWAVTAIAATWSHLAADLVFSGHAYYSDWGLKLFWPFSERAYACPVVRWGDPLPTVLLVLGMFSMLRWRSRVQVVAALTLFALLGYIGLRASIWPYD